MNMTHFLLNNLLLLLPSLALSNTFMAMQSGDIKIVPIADIARVAVGDGKIINARIDDDKELILFAREEGITSIQVWTQTGERLAYRVQVRSPKTRALKEDIRRMLARIPNVKASIVGDNIVVEGERLSDADREKVQTLAKHYPQIIDMSSQVGWNDMVMLDVKILELPRNYMQELGVRWPTQPEGNIGANISGSFLRGGGGDITAIPSTLLAQITAGLAITPHAKATQGAGVMLAQPQLMARSGATAEFLAGGELPYTMLDAQGNSQTIFKPYGVSLNITPHIEKNGTIRAKIHVEVSAVDTSLSQAGGPALKTRRTATEFNVRTGQALVLSGFISREQAQHIDKMPGLAETPILGELFKSKQFRNNETELVIIVRPQIVADSSTQVHRANAVIDSSFDAPILSPKAHTYHPAVQLSARAQQQSLPTTDDSDAVYLPDIIFTQGVNWQHFGQTMPADTVFYPLVQEPSP